MITQQSVKTAIVVVVIGAPLQMAVWILGKPNTDYITEQLSLNSQTEDLLLTTATRKTVRQLRVTLARTFLLLASIHVFRKGRSRVYSKNTAMSKVVLS